MKEHLYQLLESKRDRALHLAALTLQRCARAFFIKRRFRSLRRKIILLQSQSRGYLARCWGWGTAGVPLCPAAQGPSQPLTLLLGKGRGDELRGDQSPHQGPKPFGAPLG